MLTIRNLEVSYHDFKALSIPGTLKFSAGDRVGIIGANGAGKSTFINACLGLVGYAGEIESEVSKQDMAIHLQVNEYIESMKAITLIETFLDTSLKTNKLLQDMISFFSFEDSLNKPYKALSGGQKQRLTLIIVLLQQARITFFDEVTTGLDFATREALMRKINEWYQGKEATVFLVTHYYEELQQMANKLLILDHGKMIDYGDKNELFHKYCGYSVITCQWTAENEKSLKAYQHLTAPHQTIAISCADQQEEQDITKLLLGQDINFKRSNCDIEILSLTAIAKEQS